MIQVEYIIKELLNNYDIELSREALYAINNTPPTISLLEEFPETYGVEAFKYLIPATLKIGRLFKIKDSTNAPLKNLLYLKQFNGVAFIPLVSTTSEVLEEIKTCFGSSSYSRMMFNYVYPKFFRYKNPYVPGSKMLIERANQGKYQEEVRTYLPKFINIPTFIIRTLRNTVFDFSGIIKHTFPSRAMLSRANVFPIADKLPVQMVTRLGLKKIENEQPLYASLTTSLPPVGELFDSLIFSIKVNSTDMRIANQYLDISQQKIPVYILKNPDSIFVLGLMRFILKVIDNQPLEENNLENEAIRLILQKSHTLFLFHNDTHGFYIDPHEIKAREIKYNVIYRMIRYSLKTLIAINNKTISPLDVDTESEQTPEEAEAKLDEKIDSNNKVIHDALSEMNTSDVSKEILENTEKLLSKKDTEEAKVEKKQIAYKIMVQSKANIMRQKELGLKTQDKNEKINSVDYGQNAAFENVEEAKQDKNKKQKEEELLEGFFDEMEEDNKEGIEEDNSAEEEAKEFLGDLEEENDEKFQKTFIEQLKASTTPPLTAAEKRRLETLKNKYKSIRFDDDRTFEEILAETNTQTIDISKSEVKIKDDSFNYCLLKDFTSSYIDKMMDRDIIKTVKFFSEDKSLDMYITNFKRKDLSDQLNNISLYTFELEDKNKQKHKIKFKLPNVDQDGFMYINGNKKFLKKQLILRPVTKTKEDEVYLTSDYNKVRLYRQGTVLNRNTNLIKKIINTIISDSKTDTSLAKKIVILRGNNSLINSDYITTIEYDELSSFLHHIIINPKTKNEVAFYFNQKTIRDEITKKGINYEYFPSVTPIGIDGETNKVIDVKSLDSTDSVAEKILTYIIKYNVFPSITDIINSTKVPKRRMYSRLEIQSRDIPLIIFLSSLFDYTKVIEVSGIKTYFVKNDEKIPPDVNEHDMVFVTFADGTLYYNQYPIENALLLNGLSELNTQSIDFADLDNIATYLDWMYDIFKTRNLYKGWTAFKELFLNPKTIECLNALKQPTDFLELFLYANGLLANNTYIDSSDSRNWRVRDYEIFNSILYDTISHAYGKYKQKGKSREGFSISEEEVLKQINKDFTVANYDTVNPLNELRERSSVTYKGPKGINSNRAFTLDKRSQTRSTVGTIGISSIDNGNVGIVKQLTINPRFINTLGFIDAPENDSDVKNIPTSSLMTAEESMLPFVNRDDPKRIGFASGQTKHVIPSDNFTPQIIGTGFEQTIAYKMGNDFGYKASKDGEVVAVNKEEHFAVIKYKDGKTARVEFGEKYHRNSDFFLSNNLELAVKEGDLVKKGELITYNKDFFKKHMGRLMYTQGVVTRIAVTDGEVTEEDSSGISQRLADKLTGAVIKRNQIVIGINANIIRSVEKGDHVVYGDPLLVFENQKDEENDLSLLSILGETNEKVLDSISRHKANAHLTGEIIDIKMYWSVPPELMGESCATFVKKYIRSLNKQISFEETATKIKSKKRIETQVSVPQLDRIHGMEIPREGGILIEYYIKHSSSKRSGDKLTMNSSLKTIVCQVFPDELSPRRLQGRFRQIDMVFSFLGINARMVSSVWFSGFISKIIVEEGKRFADEFFKEIGEDPMNISQSALALLPG
jgi:hypothetical protein